MEAVSKSCQRESDDELDENLASENSENAADRGDESTKSKELLIESKPSAPLNCDNANHLLNEDKLPASLLTREEPQQYVAGQSANIEGSPKGDVSLKIGCTSKPPRRDIITECKNSSMVSANCNIFPSAGDTTDIVRNRSEMMLCESVSADEDSGENDIKKHNRDSSSIHGSESDILICDSASQQTVLVTENEDLLQECLETNIDGPIPTSETESSSSGSKTSLLAVDPCDVLKQDINQLYIASTSEWLDNQTPCMLCNHVENDMDDKSHYQGYLCHLLVEHHLVIADVQYISDLRTYAIYWKKRIAEATLEDFCSKIRTNCGAKDVAEQEEYFLLCDALPEDRMVREELQMRKLKQMLLRQEFERKDQSFERMCLFCSKIFQGNRMLLFNHMTTDHNFNIGHPDNIVNVREFLDMVEAKLESLQCLMCENTFKDRFSLREHMRKKSHRKLNPKNKDYDKFYIINYLELGKNWEKIQEETERYDRGFEDWSGWEEEVQHGCCLFCESAYDEAAKIYVHMLEEHGFDFRAVCNEMQMSFYQQVKMINYIRREVRAGRESDPDRATADIVARIKSNIQSSTKWNHPQFYFPAVDCDSMLCQLEDKSGLFEPEDTFVIGEDGIDCRAIVNNSVLTDLVVGGYFDM